MPVAFYLQQFQQHVVVLSPTCEYACLGCQHATINETSIKNWRIKTGDVVNIIGGSVLQSPQFKAVLAQCVQKKATIRVFGNHHLLTGDDSWLRHVKHVMIWCPSPHASAFNYMVGTPVHSRFMSTLNERGARWPVTLVFLVDATTFEDLPDFYDLCVNSRVRGWVLYSSSEFSKEQVAYILRMNRLPNMRVIQQPHAHANACFSVPAHLGSWRFEWQEWWAHIMNAF